VKKYLYIALLLIAIPQLSEASVLSNWWGKLVSLFHRPAVTQTVSSSTVPKQKEKNTSWVFSVKRDDSRVLAGLQRDPDFKVEILKDGKLLTSLPVESVSDPKFFRVSPDEQHVAFITNFGGGSCVWGSKLTVVNLLNFSEEQLVGYEAFNSGISTINSFSWTDGNTIMAEGTLGDIKSGCTKTESVIKKELKIAEASNSTPSSWQTYKNEQYGFEFQYPVGWQLREMKDLKRTGYVLIIDNQEDQNISGKFKEIEIRIQPEGDENYAIKGYSPGYDSIPDCESFSYQTKFIRRVTIGQNYDAKEVSIPPGDRCLQPAYYYSVNENRFRYDIDPVPGIGSDTDGRRVVADISELPKIMASFRFFTPTLP
jgi:hypothetical protein